MIWNRRLGVFPPRVHRSLTALPAHSSVATTPICFDTGIHETWIDAPGIDAAATDARGMDAKGKGPTAEMV